MQTAFVSVHNPKIYDYQKARILFYFVWFGFKDISIRISGENSISKRLPTVTILIKGRNEEEIVVLSYVKGICAPIMKQRLNFAKSYYQHLRKLHLADFSPNSINLAVDTLIGADFNGRSFHVIKRHEGHVLLLIRKLVLFLVVLSMLRKKQLQVPYFSCFKNSKRVCLSI